MTTKTDTEQLRAEFEAWWKDRQVAVSIKEDAFAAYQAGRAALQSQKPKGNDIMLSGVIRMPFEMAMANPISRMQFYQRAQQALNELEALQHSCKETLQDAEDAERYRWLRDQCQKPIGGLTICAVSAWELNPWSGDDPDKAIDHAMSVEGEKQ